MSAYHGTNGKRRHGIPLTQSGNEAISSDSIFLAPAQPRHPYHIVIVRVRDSSQFVLTSQLDLLCESMLANVERHVSEHSTKAYHDSSEPSVSLSK